MTSKASFNSEIAETERSAVAALRRETRSEHLELENRLDLLAPSLTVERYVQILLGFLDSYATLEPLVEQLVPFEFLESVTWKKRRKLDWIQQDLNFFGVTDPPTERVTAEHFDVAAEAVGVFYVMEGATLGAQLIRPHIQSTLGLDASGVRFFSAYGDETVARWAVARAVMREHLNIKSQQLAINGARKAFRYLLGNFSCRHALVP